MQNVEEKVRKYIADNIIFSKKGYPYPDDASLLENGVVDSTNILELVMLVEEEYGITTQDDEIVPDNFDSVKKIANFVRFKIGAEN